MSDTETIDVVDPEDDEEPSEPAVHIRAVEFVAESADGRTLEGYAAVFNSPTRINEMGGEFDEIIAPGAFKRSINAGTPVLMFEHGKHPLYGSMPIGHIDRLREDDRGLFVRATLHDNWLTEPLQDAIRSQAISGMSFRFSVPAGKDTWDRSGKMALRTVREAKLYELGPVVFPAYKDTTVALRSLERVIPNIHIVYDLGPDIHPEDIPEVTARDSATPDEPAPDEALPTDEPIPDPAASHSASTTRDERQALARRIYIAERNIRHG